MGGNKQGNGEFGFGYSEGVVGECDPELDSGFDYGVKRAEAEGKASGGAS